MVELVPATRRPGGRWERLNSEAGRWMRPAGGAAGHLRELVPLGQVSPPNHHILCRSCYKPAL
jgi:hypothetical protein